MSASARAVEDEVLGALVDQLVDSSRSLALRAEGLLGVDLALHDVELVVDLGQAALRLDQDQAVHAVGDVLGDHRRGAVVDVETGVQGLEGEAARLARVPPRWPWRRRPGR